MTSIILKEGVAFVSPLERGLGGVLFLPIKALLHKRVAVGGDNTPPTPSQEGSFGPAVYERDSDFSQLLIAHSLISEIMIVHYNKNLKALATHLRNNSTKSEIKLWNQLKGGQMYGCRFCRQKPINNYIADFYCKELQLVIELDGYTHHFEETFDKDQAKEMEFKELGIEVIRFSDEEVMQDIKNVLRVIEECIEKKKKISI